MWRQDNSDGMSRMIRLLLWIGLGWAFFTYVPRIFGGMSWLFFAIFFFVLLPKITGRSRRYRTRTPLFYEQEKPKNDFDFSDEKPKNDFDDGDDHRYTVGDDGELVDLDDKAKRSDYI
jgi:hypothetical protein